MAKPTLAQQLAAKDVLVAQLTAEAAATREAMAKLMLEANPVKPAVQPPAKVEVQKELKSCLFMGRKVFVGQVLQTFEVRVGEDGDIDLAERNAKGHCTFLIKKLKDTGISSYMKPVDGAFEVRFK